jgi:hypothetical protein
MVSTEEWRESERDEWRMRMRGYVEEEINMMCVCESS